MFEMNVSSVFEFIFLVVNATVLSLVLCSGKVVLKKLFTMVLIAASVLSLAGLMLTLRLPYEQIVFWKLAVVPLNAWLVIAYIHLTVTYTQKKANRIVKAGYIWLAGALSVATLCYLTQGISLLGNDTAIYAGYGIDGVVVANDAITWGIAIFLMVILRKTREPEERNRMAYLLIGSLIMAVGGALKYFIQDLPFAIAQLGYTLNMVIIAYTLLKYRLLDIQVLMRKWMVYTGVTVCMTLAYLTLLLVLSNLLRLLPPAFGIPATIVLVVLFAYLFNWIKAALDKTADRLFYGSRYIHRQLLLSFAGKSSNFINIREIANELMKPLAKAIQAKQVGLLLPVNGHFSTKFIARLVETGQITPIMLSYNSPLIKRLENSGQPLSIGAAKTEPGWENLSIEDKEAISAFQIDTLCPILCKRRMVGVLALSRKRGRGHYTRDDIDLVTMLAKESAVAIENAQIYARAREQADIDGLTGLHNHRAFQEYLNKEIEECAISGNDFSIIIIDLDFFKTYNDIYGHAMGDEILKEVGQIIKNTIRERDIGGRYGGDEFAVILKDTIGEDAKMVGERIRSMVETRMKEKGFTLTCSVGIACWRLDGVGRGTIVPAADKALYAAKQFGRNRVCLASEVDNIEARPAETPVVADNTAVESIVYSLAQTVDARDHYTFGHSKMVSKYAADLAAEVGYDKEGIRRIRAAALLHDIGKLHLPDSVLTKRGPLTNEEWELIKKHPQLALDILKYVVGLRDCINAILYHHERFDGRGYPKGLKGEDIPLDARILAIADAYDAMKSERHYKERGLTEEEALEEMAKCSGTHFDPELTEIFIRQRRQSVAEPLFEPTATAN